ncbi:MAG TPA: hypothetical protein VGX28_02050 [Frankiaceae bacterium]|jgi:hypothetical protein|nr:hypothetical protein [Frankiaceae bacterium]
MEASDVIRLPDPREDVRASVREVVRDLDGRPTVLWRLTLTGWHFVDRDSRPFMLVGDAVSDFVRITPDGVAHGYFARDLPEADRVSFGYGRVVAWDFDLRIGTDLPRLDRARLPKGVVDGFRDTAAREVPREGRAPREDGDGLRGPA